MTLAARSAAVALAALALAAPMARAADPAPEAIKACAPAGAGADSYCTIGGVRLHYVDWGGQGPAIILLAGLGNSARIFDDLAPRLTAGHRVLAFTRRGYGQSDHSQTDYSNQALVGDILGLMDRLSIGKASFVGHSIAGGELSTLGAQHPERVDRLVYFDSAYDRARAMELTDGVPAGAAPTPADLASLGALTRWRDGVLQTQSPAVRDDIGQVMALGPKGMTPRTPPAVMLKVLDGDIAAGPQYSHIKAPALALYTSKDVADQVAASTPPARRAEVIDYFIRHIRPWMLRAQADFLEQKTCGVAVELPRSTHYFFLRSPHATATMVLSYLSSADPCRWRPPLNVWRYNW